MINMKKSVFVFISMWTFLSSLNEAYSMEDDEKGKASQSNPTKKRRRSDYIDSIKISGIGEALLLRNITNGNLINTHTKHHSETFKEEVTLFRCEEETFKKIFPVHPIGDDFVDKSSFSGQIRDAAADDGIGSGCLVGMKKKKNKKIKFTCITAMHVFVGVNEKGNLVIPTKYTRKFSLGCKSLGNDYIFVAGSADVDKIMVQALPSKDICLFKGTFVPIAGLFDDEDDFFSRYHTKVPTIVKTEMDKSDNLPAFMYHHPLGKKDQRRNDGKASGNGQHDIESLYGSSGAAIFNDKFEIFGIHTGVTKGNLCKDVIAEYDGDKEIPISKSNSFELISLQDYDDLSKGVNLYGNKGFNKPLYDALVSLAESKF